MPSSWQNQRADRSPEQFFRGGCWRRLLIQIIQHTEATDLPKLSLLFVLFLVASDTVNPKQLCHLLSSIRDGKTSIQMLVK